MENRFVVRVAVSNPHDGVVVGVLVQLVCSCGHLSVELAVLDGAAGDVLNSDRFLGRLFCCRSCLSGRTRQFDFAVLDLAVDNCDVDTVGVLAGAGFG